ncbi:unnamed protein product [Closterium sp. NIES-65]|nr:unnamed protein product [Closterium sp. NIES-65]
MHHPLPPSLATIPCHHPLPPYSFLLINPRSSPRLVPFPPLLSLPIPFALLFRGCHEGRHESGDHPSRHAGERAVPGQGGRRAGRHTSMPSLPVLSPHLSLALPPPLSLIPPGDVTSLATIPAGTQASAQFLAKEGGVLAGTALATAVFRLLEPSIQVEWSKEDGDTVEKGEVFATVHGSAHAILQGERVALNFMQRMSGIATSTRQLPFNHFPPLSLPFPIPSSPRSPPPSPFRPTWQAMVEAARPATVLETRKTAPGLRITDKWAVLIGGGQNHRVGLYDMLLVKDNHIAAAGGVPAAISSAREYIRSNGLDLPVEVGEGVGGFMFFLHSPSPFFRSLTHPSHTHPSLQVEARTLDELQEVLRCRGEGVGRVTRVMLDNMVVLQPGGGDGGGAVHVDVSMLQQAVNMVNGQLETEWCFYSLACVLIPPCASCVVHAVVL